MTLQDHFRPPLGVRRGVPAERAQHAFHNAWATFIASDMNRRLPERYFAEPNVQFGIEIDVATFEERDEGVALPAISDAQPPDADGGWSGGAPARTVPIALLDDVSEVLLFHQEGGPTLAGAIELVSPSNKDRREHREAFVSKCAAYAQQGIGLLIVDVVTGRRANLHQEMVARLHAGAAASLQDELYAAAYRPVKQAGEAALEIWEEPLALGQALPVMPLWLPGDLCVPVDLDATYERTCREQRLSAGAA